MSTVERKIAENVSRVKGRIAEAAGKAGRQADAVKLLAVTKYVGPEEVQALIDAGCRDLGESRPQQLWEKVDSLRATPDGIRWHLVGHLQRNKVRRTLPMVSLIHSIDSARLLEAVQRESASLDLISSILLEINVSAEQAKHGFAPDDVSPLLERISECPNVRLDGLMAMASLQGGRDQAKRDFSSLRRLRDQLRENGPAELTLDELSMGMSRDFDLAIAEGATIVRIGSLLFDGALS